MSVVLTYSSKISAVETVALPPDVLASGGGVTHDQFTRTKVLNATSAPPISKMASFLQALTAGAATIDLTALPGTNGATVNGNGLAVRVIKFIASATNVAAVTLKFGAANPYLLLGTGWQIAVQPGQEVLFDALALAPTIGAGAKNIDMAGTGTDGMNVSVFIG